MAPRVETPGNANGQCLPARRPFARLADVLSRMLRPVAGVRSSWQKMTGPRGAFSGSAAAMADRYQLNPHGDTYHAERSLSRNFSRPHAHAEPGPRPGLQRG